MTFPDASDERQTRREFVRRRQKMVFTITISALVVIAIAASLYVFGELGHFSEENTQIKPNYGVSAPCAPANSTFAKHTDVRVRVLNGTNKTGLGVAVMKALRNRGFNMQGAGDYTAKTELARTEIRFGINGIAQGYTVAKQFNDAMIRMDDREDDLVDVVIGATFNDLADEEKVTSIGQPITSITGCVADPKTMHDLPKAEH